MNVPARRGVISTRAESPGAMGGRVVPGVAAPAAHAVVQTPEFQAVPVDGERELEAVVDDDLRRLPARQDQRAAGDPRRVGRRHGILPTCPGARRGGIA
jgi:hypothetical protein